MKWNEMQKIIRKRDKNKWNELKYNEVQLIEINRNEMF